MGIIAAFGALSKESRFGLKGENRFLSEKNMSVFTCIPKKKICVFLHGYSCTDYLMQKTGEWKNKNKRFKKRLQCDDLQGFLYVKRKRRLPKQSPSLVWHDYQTA